MEAAADPSQHDHAELSAAAYLRSSRTALAAACFMNEARFCSNERENTVLDVLWLEKPVWEMVLRGTAVYWSLFIVFRFVLRRDVGAMSVADLLFVVLVADAASNAMQGDYKTVGDGFVLLATLAGWNYLMDWLGYRVPAVARFMEPPAEVVVRHGRPNRRVLAREMMTMDELRGKLREQGVESIGEVRIARLESDGTLSVFTRDGKRHANADSNSAGQESGH
ncbi:DUF421 domain-containing protein [Variovorax sp. KK3]|uniref:DUF421 domain-containing protein n=1 Tax=Variovorax sp. KK3 TaxID=1855728 RepID=UPI00211802DC|nr:YetF domain-containing protein [Variovorax sp. KK3]